MPRLQLIVARASKGTANNAKPLPLPLLTPPPLPPPSVRAASILAIREQARDGQLSRGTIVGLAATTIAQQCQGTFVHPSPPPTQKQATVVRPHCRQHTSKQGNGQQCLGIAVRTCRQLVVTPVSKGLPTMARHCKTPSRQLDIALVSLGRPTMPRHPHPPRRQRIVARASKGTANNAAPLSPPLFAPQPLPLPSVPATAIVAILAPTPRDPSPPQAPNREGAIPTSRTPIAR